MCIRDRPRPWPGRRASALRGWVLLRMWRRALWKAGTVCGLCISYPSMCGLCGPAVLCSRVLGAGFCFAAVRYTYRNGGVLGLGLWAQSAADARPPRAPASAPDTAEAGKDPWIRRAVTGELPEPHAPSALLELSSLDPGLGACLRRMRSRQHRAGLSHRTRVEIRSSCSPACGPGSVGHLVYLV